MSVAGLFQGLLTFFKEESSNSLSGVGSCRSVANIPGAVCCWGLEGVKPFVDRLSFNSPIFALVLFYCSVDLGFRLFISPLNKPPAGAGKGAHLAVPNGCGDVGHLSPDTPVSRWPEHALFPVLQLILVFCSSQSVLQLLCLAKIPQLESALFLLASPCVGTWYSDFSALIIPPPAFHLPKLC